MEVSYSYFKWTIHLLQCLLIPNRGNLVTRYFIIIILSILILFLIHGTSVIRLCQCLDIRDPHGSRALRNALYSCSCFTKKRWWIQLELILFVSHAKWKQHEQSKIRIYIICSYWGQINNANKFFLHLIHVLGPFSFWIRWKRLFLTNFRFVNSVIWNKWYLILCILWSVLFKHVSFATKSEEEWLMFCKI